MSKALDFFHTDLGVKNTMSGSIVGFERSTGGRLFVTHFFENSNHGNGFLGVEKKTTGFGFGGGGGDSANHFATNVNGTIGPGVGRRAGCAGKGGEEEIAGSTATSIRKNEIGGVGAHCKNHITGVILTDSGIGVGGEIVKEHVAS